MFVAGGTGEFFSLTLDECRRIVVAAATVAAGRVPIIAGVGYGTAMAIEFARAAEASGADGILVLPPYLVKAEQEGLFRHLDAICRATALAVIPYNRDNCLLAPETLARLAERHENLIGFKDGHGDVEQLGAIRQALGERVAYIGGMPTAEIFAVPYLAAGFTTYSSAVFNFIPRIALRFHAAVRAGDRATTDDLLRRFFLPLYRAAQPPPRLCRQHREGGHAHRRPPRRAGACPARRSHRGGRGRAARAADGGVRRGDGLSPPAIPSMRQRNGVAAPGPGQCGAGALIGS